jgi:hypothetical protein
LPFTSTVGTAGRWNWRTRRSPRKKVEAVAYRTQESDPSLALTAIEVRARVVLARGGGGKYQAAGAVSQPAHATGVARPRLAELEQDSPTPGKKRGYLSSTNASSRPLWIAFTKHS